MMIELRILVAIVLFISLIDFAMPECYPSDSNNYRGRQSFTEFGHKCVAWDDKRVTPSSNKTTKIVNLWLKLRSYLGYEIKNMDGTDDHSYCRNVRTWHDKNGPWCFIANSFTPGARPRYETCAIRRCMGGAESLGLCDGSGRSARVTKNETYIVSHESLYSEEHLPDRDCRWLVVAPNNHVIILNFEVLDLEQETDGSGTCIDYLELQENGSSGGATSSRRRTVKLCGVKNKFSVISSTNAVKIRFVSDESIQSKRGFRAFITFKKLTVTQAGKPAAPALPKHILPCVNDSDNRAATQSQSSHLQINKSNLYILSHEKSQDEPYENEVKCQATITAPVGHVVILTFTFFELEKETDCDYDRLEVADGLSKRIFCGEKSAAQSFSSETNRISLTFTTDVSDTYLGFKIHVKFVRKTCGLPTLNNALEKIVGGNKSKEGSWPWQVQLAASIDGDHFCGGSIIADRWVITAAHCLVGKRPYQIKVKAGKYHVRTISGSEQTRSAETFYIHREFSSATNGYDIAIIRLATPFDFDERVAAVCLPIDQIAAKHNCYITGFGSTLGTGHRFHLKEAKVPIISRQVCNTRLFYNNAIRTDMICAGFRHGGVDSCKGDSGGPLVCPIDDRFYLTGITSWGRFCARATKPGIYVNVIDYVDWIKDVIEEN